MLFLVAGVIYFLSLKFFALFCYDKVQLSFNTSYKIPKRFYNYFLFLVLLSSLLLVDIFFIELKHRLILFTLLYIILFLFFGFKGFKIIGYFVIKILEACLKINLLLFSLISTVAIILIFYSIFYNSFEFFKEIGITNFLFKTNWSPENYTSDPSNSFGVIPLIINTVYITLFSVIVAMFFGVLIAIYLSEYIKSKRISFLLKSIFEIIAGIPSMFYGFFGAFILAPKVVIFFNSLGIEMAIDSIIIPSIAIGIMMIPYVATLLDDAFSSIPKTLKDASTAMGLTRFETIKKLIIPIAIPEIISTLIIVVARVLGETMIVLLTCGIIANMTFNPLEPSTTITVQIVHLLTGDTSFDSLKTLSVFGLSMFLFIATMTLNIISVKIKNKVKY